MRNTTKTRLINCLALAVLAPLALATGQTVPVVGPLPSQLVFPSQLVNTVSNAQSFPLSNTGTAPLTVFGIGATGTFGETNNCGASLAAGASCTVNVFFISEGVGLSTGTVVIVDNNDNVPGNSQTVNLSGTGVTAPMASISPASLTFGSQLVGTGSESQAVTLSNAANAEQLSISGVTASGDFSATNNCGGSVAGGTSCTINVTFTPTAEGQRTGTLTVTDNGNGATGSIQTVSLTGSGRPAGENATPFISDISPVSAAPGGASFVLTVRGGGFTAPALHWQVGKTVTKLTAATITKETFTVTIPASLIATAHTATLTAVNPDSAPATGVSNTVPFPVAAPTPAAIFSQTAVGATAGSLAVVTADFNNDGKADLAVTYQSGVVLILLGNGKGQFKKTSTATVGENATALAVGDFNGDGKLDLAVAGEGIGTISILLGNGDGTFNVGAPVPVGNGPGALVVGDFNGDGYLDLAVGNFGDRTLSILLGNGDGTFALLDTLPMLSVPNALAAGDFNGDGKLDLAVALAGYDMVQILLGAGDGTFTVGSAPSMGAGPMWVAVGDFNGDGFLDMAVACPTGDAVVIFLGAGDGTFTGGPTLYAGPTPSPVTVADFNGDGKMDLAAANYVGGTVTILHGNGDGTFSLGGASAVGGPPFGLAVADFNGDGKMDVATAGEASIGILVQPAFSVSSDALSFTTALRKTSPPQTVTVTNTGTATLTFTSIKLGGTTPGAFAQTGTCTGSLLPAASCEIEVTYTADKKNKFVSATLTLTDSEGKQEIALLGTDQ
jgi:hypothetical protein